jgi:hypothetical protein
MLTFLHLLVQLAKLHHFIVIVSTKNMHLAPICTLVEPFQLPKKY